MSAEVGVELSVRSFGSKMKIQVTEQRGEGVGVTRRIDAAGVSDFKPIRKQRPGFGKARFEDAAGVHAGHRSPSEREIVCKEVDVVCVRMEHPHHNAAVLQVRS